MVSARVSTGSVGSKIDYELLPDRRDVDQAAASFSNQAWSASVSAGETRLHGVSKKQATAPKSEPNAPSFFTA